MQQDVKTAFRHRELEEQIYMQQLDLAHAVNVASKYMSNPGKEH